MTDPAEPRTREGGPVHDVSHLHAVGRRESENMRKLAASSLAVAEGLACYSDGRGAGRVTVHDRTVTASPPFAAGTIAAERLTHAEPAAWLISAASQGHHRKRAGTLVIAMPGPRKQSRPRQAT